MCGRECVILPLMTNPAERRRWPRERHETPITAKVLASTSASLAPGHTFESSTRDISQSGLCLRVNTPVHAGTELAFWLISSHHRDTLVLSGVVRWSLPVQGDPTLYQIGVELSDQPAGDYGKWKKMVADLTRVQRE